MEVPLVVGLLSPAVLASYFTLPRKSYLTHPLWFGMPKELIYFVVAMQVLAALGFIVAVVSWSLHRPTEGLLSTYVLPVTLAIFLIASAGWAGRAGVECAVGSDCGVVRSGVATDVPFVRGGGAGVYGSVEPARFAVRV